ncbi:MAG: transcription antitermination factor NusB [Clostridiales Family XIII bacterium]|jgi:N utilization substance protein B|nr:transcription antitermination factor NusB [Clostridiales Family XIII bacterium]
MKKTAPVKKTTYRKKTRELLMRLIFQMSATGDYSERAKDEFMADTSLYLGDTPADAPPGCLFDEKNVEERPDMSYFNWALSCFTEHVGVIDDIIGEASEKWSVRRMSTVDLSILRLAVAEICYMDDISDSISVNEAVVMAKKYGTEKSAAFINGVLGQIIRSKEIP